MHAILIFAFVVMVVAPLWGRWRVYRWVRDNMPEEIGIPRLPETDLNDCAPESFDATRERLVTMVRAEL